MSKLQPQNPAVIERLPELLKKLQAMKDGHTSTKFPTLTSDLISVEYGGRYARVVSTHRYDGRQTGQRSVYCFVDLTNGDLLKAATWKGPAKHARSNILADDYGMSAATPYGLEYLR